MARSTLLCLVVLVAPQILLAQAPIPVGESIPRMPSVTLSGTVQTKNGKLLANTPIRVKDAAGSEHILLSTGAKGEFRVPLPPGRYTITAAAENGRNAVDQVVDVYPNQSSNIRLTVGDYVPVGEATPKTGGVVTGAGMELRAKMPPDVIAPASGSVAVSGVFTSAFDLAAWLNGQSEKNLRLQAIVSSAPGAPNLFVWIAHAGADQHFVLPGNQVGTSDQLQTVLKAYPQEVLIGLVWVGKNPYLVLRTNL